MRNVLKLIFLQYLLRVRRYFIRKFTFRKTKRTQKLEKLNFKELYLNSLLRYSAISDLFGPSASAVLFDTKNGHILASTYDVEISRQLGFVAGYDIAKIHNLKNFIGPESNIFILGAHIGTLAIPLSLCANKVYAFEPNPESRRLLIHNKYLNQRENIEVFPVGTYNEDTELKFLMSKANTGGSKMSPVREAYMYDYDNPIEMTIPVVNLDNFVKTNSLPYPDGMIIDIEGAEFHTLQGAYEILANCGFLYIEFVPHHLTNVAGVEILDFVQIITRHFSKMKIDAAGRIYKGKEIDEILEYNFLNGICCDLLFFKNIDLR